MKHGSEAKVKHEDDGSDRLTEEEVTYLASDDKDRLLDEGGGVSQPLDTQPNPFHELRRKRVHIDSRH